MDETVYQCPECNFNADNISELDSHLVEFHSNDITHNSSGGSLHNRSGGAMHLNGHHQQQHHGHHHRGGHHAPRHEYEDDEDFFNEKNGRNHGRHHYEDYENGEVIVHDEEPAYQFNSNSSRTRNGGHHIPPQPQHRPHQSAPTPQFQQRNNNNNGHHMSQVPLSKPVIGGGQPYRPASQHQQPQPSSTSPHLPIKPIPTNGITGQPIQKPIIPNSNMITAAALASANVVDINGASQNGGSLGVLNSDNHYERQYACQRCNFFTNNPRAILYHRKEFHLEKINVHECQFCQYASQYSGKVERHTLLRHKIDVNTNASSGSASNAGGNAKMPSMRKSDLNGSSSNLAPAGNDSMYLNESLTNENNINNENTNTSANGAINLVPNFQCHLCPCKYKRSNDLTKHLRLKHHILGPRSGGTAFNKSVNGIEPEDEYDDMDELDQMNENGEYNTSNEDIDSSSSHHIQQHQHPQHQSQHSNRNINHRVTSPVKPLTNGTNNQPKANNTDELLCPYCIWTSRVADDYLSHVRDHLNGKMFRCVLCNSVYKYRGDCVVHLKRKHQSADMIAHNYVDKFVLDTMPLHDICTLLKPKQTDETAEGGVEQDKLFGCAYCDYKANYKGDVYKHQTRRHPGTPKLINSLADSTNHSMARQSLDHLGRMQQHNMNSNNMNNTFNNSGEYNEEYEDYDGAYDEEEELGDEDSASGSGGGGGSAGVDRPIAKLPQQQQPLPPTLVNNGPKPSVGINKDVISLEGEDEEDYEDYRNHHLQHNGGEYDDDVDEINDEMMMDNDEEDLMMDGYDDEEENEHGGEDFFNEHDHSNGNGTGAQLNGSQSQMNRFNCNYCSFTAASHAKLQSHMAIHYNLKPFMCPICRRRANFKWDIQKHMRKIHNDHTSEVVCLTEAEARESITSYIESMPSYNVNNTMPTQTTKPIAAYGKFAHSASNSPFNPLTMSTNGSLKEKRFRCSLCTRVNSRWQYDVKKHIRNVHKGEGDVLIVEVDVDPERFAKYQRHSSAANQTMPLLGSNASFSNGDLSPNKPVGLNQSLSSHLPGQQQPTPQYYPGNASSNNTDTSGNKKFLCALCPYRSNWKADMYRHLRKRHDVPQPGNDDMTVLSPEEAAATLEAYERQYGMNVRKRARVDLQDQLGQITTTAVDTISKRFKSTLHNTDSSSVLSVSSGSQMGGNNSGSVSSSGYNKTAAHMATNDEQEDLNREELVDTKAGGVERLPVSIAELNIKPYKCLRCGFRSDRKSDTLRHIRIKHDLEALQAYKFLKIMSIKDASESIEEYESTRTYRKSSTAAGGASSAGSLNTSVSRLGSVNINGALPLSIQNKLQQLHQTTATATTSNNNIGQTATNNNQSGLVNNNGANKLTINLAMLNRMKQQATTPTPQSTTSPTHQQQHHHQRNSQLSALNKNATDYFKCPFCVFKNVSRMVIKKHLSTHFYGSQIERAPVYQCSQCRFRSEWQYAVKRHIITAHMNAATAANCVRIDFGEPQQLREAGENTEASYRRLVRKKLNRARRRLRLRRARNVIVGEPVMSNTNAAQQQQQQQPVVKHEVKSVTSSSASTISTASSSMSSAKLSSTTTNSTANTLPIQQANSRHGVKREAVAAAPHGQYHHHHHHNNHMSDEDEFHDLDETYNGEEHFDDMDEGGLDHDMDDMDDMDEISPPHSTNTAETLNTLLKNGGVRPQQQQQPPQQQNITHHNAEEDLAAEEDDENVKKHIESISLTDHDGKDFTVSYFVGNAPAVPGAGGSVNNSLNNSINNDGTVKKKTYYCQSCPYKTNNYCNLKQHLLLHRYRDGCYKCRYCPYYVTMVRLIKQHEIIHSEYEPRGGDEQLPPQPLQTVQQHHHRGGMPFASYTNNISNVTANNSNNKHQQLIN